MINISQQIIIPGWYSTVIYSNSSYVTKKIKYSTFIVNTILQQFKILQTNNYSLLKQKRGENVFASQKLHFFLIKHCIAIKQLKYNEKIVCLIFENKKKLHTLRVFWEQKDLQRI